MKGLSHYSYLNSDGEGLGLEITCGMDNFMYVSTSYGVHIIVCVYYKFIFICMYVCILGS